MKEMIAQIIREEMMRNQKTYYFIAGMPRSGSSLLSAILNQNPKFYSGPSSPVLGIMNNLENVISNDELFLAYPKPQQAGELITNVIRHYYSDITQPVIFDKNRAWTNYAHYLEGYFGISQPKILCPVRNLDEVLASFIAMHRRNPFHVNGKINFIDEMLVKNNIPLTDDNRCEFLAGPNGIVGQSYEGIRKALSTEVGSASVHLIEYDDLITNPEETMKSIYAYLNEDYFEHSFENIVKPYAESDAEVYGITDMHSVAPNLKTDKINPSDFLSERILGLCANQEFWRSKLKVSSVVQTSKQTFFSEEIAIDEEKITETNQEETATNLIGVN
jgi:sulfotransferase